jgi:hypothetical protein
MTYTVIKTINGRRYRYLQETYRQNGKVRTRNVYLGPVDGELRRKRGVTAFIQELVRKPDRNFETEAQARVRVAREDRERAKQARINDLLTAPTISLDAINEIANSQVPGETMGESGDVSEQQASEPQ